jgi:catechol 2,3-dioxygenase-like lactoylglutathione lyase family enzyme
MASATGTRLGPFWDSGAGPLADRIGERPLAIDEALAIARQTAEALKAAHEPGFRVSAGRHYFDCGGVILALHNPGADGDDQTVRPNFEHVYFVVDDLEAVFARAQRIGGLSAEIGDGRLPMGTIAQRPWGERSFYMQDPSGNPLCFVDETTLFTGPPASPH